MYSPSTVGEIIMDLNVVCPKDPRHKQFITVVHVAQDWVVDEKGEFLAVSNECTDVVAKPDPGNTWQCNECGEEAVVRSKNSDPEF